MALGGFVLGGLLLVAACTDFARRRIPNQLICVGLCAFLVIAAWLCRLRETAILIGCLKAGALAFVLHLVPYGLRSMGAGDVKLALVVGLLLGWETWLGYLEVFCVAALLVSCFALLSRKWGAKGGEKGEAKGGAKAKPRPLALPLAPVMAAAYLCHQMVQFRA